MHSSNRWKKLAGLLSEGLYETEENMAPVVDTDFQPQDVDHEIVDGIMLIRYTDLVDKMIPNYWDLPNERQPSYSEKKNLANEWAYAHNGFIHEFGDDSDVSSQSIARGTEEGLRLGLENGKSLVVLEYLS